MPYSFSCDECDHEITSQDRPRGTVERICVNPQCRTRLYIRSADWTKIETNEAYNPVSDKYKTAMQLWGTASKTFFSISMRFDANRPPKTKRYTLGHSFQHCYDKTKVGKVKAEKGGRKDGKSIMGYAARDLSNRANSSSGKQDEEWLHLWGDNLGGPSDSSNFVAGSYAANTEMLVIENMLANNIDFTEGLRIEVTALCDRTNVAEYILYEIISPYQEVNNFCYCIDCNNKYFTKQDYDVVKGVIEDWMIAYICYWYVLHPNAK